jgi:hypothetical protein
MIFGILISIPLIRPILARFLPDQGTGPSAEVCVTVYLTMQHNETQCNTMQHNTTQCNTMQHSTSLTLPLALLLCVCV